VPREECHRRREPVRVRQATGAFMQLSADKDSRLVSASSPVKPVVEVHEQVKEGDTVPLTLVFEGKDGKRETVEVKAPVRALNASAQPAAGHGGHKH